MTILLDIGSGEWGAGEWGAGEQGEMGEMGEMGRITMDYGLIHFTKNLIQM
jgi:hypothetical protein